MESLILKKKHMKICLTTFIYGNTYQNYIPLILYSVAKSYPEYHVKIFINGSLRADLRNSLNLIEHYYTNFSIIENHFNDCPEMTPLKAKSLRWVLWDESFLDYDYLYYIDSDILYMREPMALHEQHINHMKFINSDCVSNIMRKKEIRNSDLFLYLSVIKYGGISSLLRYPFNKFEYRMSGLHFVKVSSYFKYLTVEKLEWYREKIYNGKAFNGLLYPNDETLLYYMMKESGCNVSNFAIQQSSSSMFDFNNPYKKEFCPHHGIHLGIFRVPNYQNIEWTKEQLDSEDYLYYRNIFQQEWLSDIDFHSLYPLLPYEIQKTFKDLINYYNISSTLISKIND